jgi:hypothetical protein
MLHDRLKLSFISGCMTQSNRVDLTQCITLVPIVNLSCPTLSTVTGGYFFGTVPDGKRVLAALNRRPTLECPMLTLAAQTFCEEGSCTKGRAARTAECTAHGQPPPAVFGSAYTCAIGDTVTAGGLASLLNHSSHGVGEEGILHMSSASAFCDVTYCPPQACINGYVVQCNKEIKRTLCRPG